MKPLLLLGMVIASVTSVSALAAKTGPHCVNSSAGTCVVPFQALFGTPLPDYAGLVVQTSGVLRKDGQSFMLFADTEIAGYAPRESAIVLVDKQGQFGEPLQSYVGRFVRVAGRIAPVSEFNAGYWAELELVRAPWPMAQVVDAAAPPPPPKKP